MAIDTTFYGDIAEADVYFSVKLHEYAWSAATTDEKTRALYGARQIIDTLNYKGHKATVYTLLDASPNASDEDIRAAEAAQPLEFPRGEDTTVPETIRMAAYEIAYTLLDGKDPDKELENLGIVSQGFGPVKTTYNRNQVPIENIINGVPSPKAWAWIRPFLRDDDAITLSRIS